MSSDSRVSQLIARGVVVPQPSTVFVDDGVDVDSISVGTVIHPHCRISGSMTAVGRDCVLGDEGPVTLRDCCLGARVVLHGGSFTGSVLWDDVVVGPSAHVRPGCILEEEVSCGHAVGLKQTYLLPFVTLGSLINLCDCLMAGGTSRRNHSEVGSSYVHFNYTPDQDKATPSLFGDTVRGALLREAPIFLGGQGGAVGPVHVAYGTIVAAGSILRRDQLTPGRLVRTASSSRALSIPFQPGGVRGLGRRVRNNVLYVANLHAAYWWYRSVRAHYVEQHPRLRACYDAALLLFDGMVGERIKRLGQVASRAAAAGDDGDAARLAHTWPFLAGALALGDKPPAGAFPATAQAEVTAAFASHGYVDAIQGLSDATTEVCMSWLTDVVDAVSAVWDSTDG